MANVYLGWKRTIEMVKIKNLVDICCVGNNIGVRNAKLTLLEYL